ncbi:GMC family oxidoreductase [Deinococcus sp. NW-56]|uniref:GMC family oxidoreductase n=1 Tax=Deinococcus sp. NW-56 TaxID=2080419 RepID=UPI000CF3EBDC|nr:GMC family oxidoreductase [Deinococcus sp. NW-56]
MTQPAPLTPTQRRTLRALTDTFVPALRRSPDPHRFCATPGSATGAPDLAAEVLAGLPEAERRDAERLLDVLDRMGLRPETPLALREGMLRGLARLSPPAAQGLGNLRKLLLMLTYAHPGGEGTPNPFWRQFGYAGPTFTGASTERDVATLTPEEGETLETDVVVVGSGAGGGVIAGELSAAGLRVIVLEAGRQHADAELGRSELWAYQNLYWRGGFTPTADGNVSLIAGRTLGGGTTVNWMNCVRTPPEVRREWALAGLNGVNGPEFDADTDAVMERIGATDQASEYNGTHVRMLEGALRLGYRHRRAYRNVDLARHDPRHAGHIGFGDATGAKQSTLKTYLKDAAARGARIVEGATAERLLTEGGRAAGVAVTVQTTCGARQVTVRAPQVVVAGGSLETPALLLRSGLGGPAVGKHLHLHPCGALTGTFADEQDAWWGATQAAIVDEFAGRTEGFGYLIETSQYTTGLFASAAAWPGGAAHKTLMADHARSVTLIHLTCDRGSGEVTLDERGQPRVTYAVTDPLDVENYWHGQGTVARILAAAGAERISALADGVQPWTRGKDLEAWIAGLRRLPIGRGGHAVFSAHQMGSARMGQDPRTSVADPRGELHGTPGVWIGDTSAFPTSSGANPMVSVMALARRTARFISQEVGASAGRRPEAVTAGSNA